MTTKRPSRRFITEAEILAAIDRTERLALKRGKEAEELDRQYKQLVKDNSPARWEVKEKADKLWQRYHIIKGTSMKRLKNKLAEFLTPMALVGTGRDDNSVKA